MVEAKETTSEFCSDPAGELIVVVTVRGGIVQDVHATEPVHVFAEEWDCPPAKPLVIDFGSEPLTSQQWERIETCPKTAITSKGE